MAAVLVFAGACVAAPRAGAAASTVTFRAAPGSPFAVGSTPYSVAVGDFNSDGKPDLAVPNWSDGNVSVLLADGSGGFSPAPGSPVAVGTRPGAVAVADFNGDGHSDLAVANVTGSGGNSVSVLLGDGHGGFNLAPGSPFAADIPDSVAVGDFNGDGHPDIAVADYSNTVSVLLGDGTGRFSAAPGSPFAVGNTPYSVAAGDFNGDGHPDLAVANQGSNSVSVLLGDGTGGFIPAAGSPIAVGRGPDGVAVGDLSADGHLDLVVANGNSNSVSVLLGDGTGGFIPTAGSPIAVGHGAASVAVGNFDGKPGLAITNAGDDTVSVLLGDGAGGFSAAAGSPFAIGRGPQGVTIGDLNGDGEPDLVVADVNESDVSVLLWRAYSPPPPGAVGVSINNGDFATNSRNVLLYVVWPQLASEALLSNDGGFGAAGSTETVPLAPTIPWTLPSAGSERLPKTVYLRFPDSANPLLTFTDDIILDTTTPVVQSATTAGSISTETDNTATAARSVRIYGIRIHATEGISGISQVQVSHNRSGGTMVVLADRKRRGIRKLSTVITARTSQTPRYLRVQSAAGNWSRWHQIASPTRS